MSNVIQFKRKKSTDENLYRLTVFSDQEQHGEVVASIESSEGIDRSSIIAHLDQLSWKSKNMEAADGNQKGQVALVITQYENHIEFVENPEIKKDKAYIDNLRKELNNIVQALESLS